MSFPKYFVTYCAMDEETGSNPLWHASLVLSKQGAHQEPIHIVDSFGFYSQPSTTTNPFVKGLKRILGFTINLQDGHGELKQEAMRYLDGNGLHGLSFYASKEQFEALIQLYQQKIELEQEAIKELDDDLKQQGTVANTCSRYRRELDLATLQNRPPRLQPFHVVISLSKTGLDSSTSQTCKTYALNLLLETGIINQATCDAIHGGLAKYAMPRYSAIPLLPFRLVSTGEPEAQRSRTTHSVFYNRHWKKNNLFWATPLHVHKDTSAKPNHSTTKDLYPELKNTLSRVKKTEHLLRQHISELNSPPKANGQLIILNEQLARVEALLPTFCNAHDNQSYHGLTQKLLHARKTLNIANMCLNPEKIDESFRAQIYGKAAVSSAILCLLLLLILDLSIRLSGETLGSLMTIAITIYVAYKLITIYNETVILLDMHKDYSDFQQTKQPLTETREADTENPSLEGLASTA